MRLSVFIFQQIVVFSLDSLILKNQNIAKMENFKHLKSLMHQVLPLVVDKYQEKENNQFNLS